MSIKSIKRKFRIIMFVTLLLILIGIIGISLIINYGINKEIPEAKGFSLNSKKNSYVTMNILYLESIGNTGDKYYYNATIGDNKYAIITVDDPLYNKINASIYKNGFYQLEGYLRKMHRSLFNSTMDYYQEKIDKNINKDNYQDYFNINYLDQNYRPHYYSYVILIVIISIIIICSILVFFSKMICLVHFYINCNLYDNLEKELNEKNVKILKKEGFCLTKNYLFTGKTYHVYPYKDIYWIYNIERYQRNKLIARDLVIGLSNGKEKIIWTYDIKSLKKINNATELIYQKNKNMLYKYSEENEKKYHEMVGDLK